MLGFGKVWSGIKWLGRGFGKVLGLLHDLIPDEVERAAWEAVKQAALNATLDNAARREWAVGQVMRAGASESIARLAVELAVTGIKNKLP